MEKFLYNEEANLKKSEELLNKLETKFKECIDYRLSVKEFSEKN